MASLVDMDKDTKLTVVKTVLRGITEHLKNYLPIANAHMTDFIVDNWWEKHLTPQIREDLLSLEPNDLINLPSGRLYQIDDSEKASLEVDLDSETLTLCVNLSMSQESRPQWDRRILPTWRHHSLESFIVACQRASLPHSKLLSSLSDVAENIGQNKEDVPIIEFMTAKKSHEVEIMSELCASLAQLNNISKVIDLGSGKGYLGSHLALKHGLHVLGVDCSTSNTSGAEGRSQRLAKRWAGLVTRSRRRLGAPTPDAEPTGVRGVFVPITQFVDKTTDLQELLRSRLDADMMLDSDLSPGACSERTASQTPYMIAGLHACGDLTPNTLRLFLGDVEGARVLCNVGCCYHHLTEAYVACPFGNGDGLTNEETGFPLSSYLRSRGCQLGRNARMLASQAPDRIAENAKLPSRSLFWRALLQLILRDTTPARPGEEGHPRDWQVGRIAAKCTEGSFTEYVHRAYDKLGLHCPLSAPEISAYESRHAGRESHLQRFVQLKAALAPCVEAAILLDRMCYLLEQDCVADVHVIQAFDPVTSPRCYALVASKTDNWAPELCQDS